MSALRFRVGEIAVYCNLRGDYARQNGEEVEVVRAGPFPAGTKVSGRHAPGCTATITYQHDYEVRERDGTHWFCHDNQLRKRPAPGIPDSVRAWFDVPVKQGDPA